jgi:membrane fusion protein (multidrug efflux system)
VVLAGLAITLTLGGAGYGRYWWTTGRFIEMTDDAYAGGNITAISPHVAGFVAQILVGDNQHVRAGQLLIRLAAARQQLLVLDAQIAEARAGIAQAKADLETARLNLGYTEVRSPIEGYIGNRAAQVGAYVASGAYLLSVIPAHGLWVDANFKENQLARMRLGQRASVVADVLPGQVFHGHVLSLAPGTGAVFSVIPPENATGNFTKIVQRVPVRIALDDGDARLGTLRPGLSATVSVDTRPPGKRAE